MFERMDFHQYFNWTDWAVVGAYLGVTTWVEASSQGKQSTIKDFFLGGRSLPWLAVSGSIIATEISGVTFIGFRYGLRGRWGFHLPAMGNRIDRRSDFGGIFLLKFSTNAKSTAPMITWEIDWEWEPSATWRL